MRFLLSLLITSYITLVICTWTLQSSFEGTPQDHVKDNGASKIYSFFNIQRTDTNNGFPGALSSTVPGDPTLFIDSEGYLVMKTTCPLHVNGTANCKAVQCGEKKVDGTLCSCNNATLENKYFPWWCQEGWHSSAIYSKETFNINDKGGLFVFEDVWIPRQKPLWPAIWLDPVTNPIFGGKNTPVGGDYDVWPNNGEIDILETIGNEPQIYGTLHYSCGDEYYGWPNRAVKTNSSAKKGSAYNTTDLLGNVLALRKSGNNPLAPDGFLGTLCFQWNVDEEKGPVFTWWIAKDGNPIDENGDFTPSDQMDVMVNRFGTERPTPTGSVLGDGSGTISFSTTPFWPGSAGNSPPLTLYKGWDGKESYGYQGYYPIQGNVEQSTEGIHEGTVSKDNPKGLGIVPKFFTNGTMMNGTIDHLYEPLLCSMIGDWSHSNVFPREDVRCLNPPPGYDTSHCPQDGKGPKSSYNYCKVEGAKEPGIGWWSNSPLAKGVPYAPFSTTQNWNIALNVQVGGTWPRNVGQEGQWKKNFGDVPGSPMRIKSIKYYVQK